MTLSLVRVLETVELSQDSADSMNNGSEYILPDEAEVRLLDPSQEEVTFTVATMPTALPSYLAEIDKASRTNGGDIHMTGMRSSPKHSIPHNKSLCCAGSTGLVIRAAALSALGGVLFGYDIGIISGALLQLRVDFCLSCPEREAVVSTMLGGAILASLTGGFLVDYFGRRVTIIVNCNIFIIGAVILAAAPSFAVLIVGRVIVGYAVALSVIAECVYISEISPHKKRGMLVSLNELGIVTGFLLAYLVNFAFIQKENGWRYMFGLSIIPAVVQGFGMLFLPASPRYLISKGRLEEARQVLQMLHGNVDTEEELENIKTAIKDEKSHSFLDLFRKQDNMRYRMFIGMGLVFFQQFTGQPNIMYYAPTIFQSIGFHSDTAATLAALGLGFTKVVFCVLALLLLDRVGRRKLLLTGAFFMAVSIIILSVVTLQVPRSDFVNPCNLTDISNCKQPVEGDHNNAADARQLHRRSVYNDLNDIRAFVSSGLFYNKTSQNLESQLLGGKNPKENSVGYEQDIITSNDTHSLENDRNLKNRNIDLRIRISGDVIMVERSGLEKKRVLKRDVTEVDKSDEQETSLAASPKETHLDTAAKWIGLVSLVGFVGSYGIGFGAGTWLILAEIFPSAVRGRAIAIATVFNWGTNLVMSSTFLEIINAIGVSWTFLPYGVISVLAGLFVYFFVPETKGKTLEQIGHDFQTWSCTSQLPCCRNTVSENRGNSYRIMEDEEDADLTQTGFTEN